MAITREPRAVVEWDSNGAFMARFSIRGTDQPVTMGYFKFLVERSPLDGPGPHNAVALVLPSYESAPNLIEAKALAAATLAKLVVGDLSPEERPVKPHERPLRHSKAAHPTKAAAAITLKWRERFEVYVIGFAADGHFPPTAYTSSHPEFTWCDLLTGERLYTDTPEEAQAAVDEEFAKLNDVAEVQNRVDFPDEKPPF